MEKEVLSRIVKDQYNDYLEMKGKFSRIELINIDSFVKHPAISVISGIRRCGKSIFLEQIMDKYFKDNFYYFDFSDERITDFKTDDFQILYEVFLEKFGEKKVFFFDEIQGIPNWNKFVNRMKKKDYKVFVTGSNAHLLSKEISTFLTGRHLDKVLFPFSFKEYLRYNNVSFDLESTKNRVKIITFFKKYFKLGGFPEVVTTKDDSILLNIYSDIISKDIITRYNIKDVNLFKEFANYIISLSTNEFTYSSLSKHFNISNISTVSNYINYLKQTYLIYEVKRFSTSLQKLNKYPKKYYTIDNGLLYKIGYPYSIGDSRLLENQVLIELWRRNSFSQIYYYKDENERECDFIVLKNRKVSEAIQVVFKFDKPETKEREINGLLSALKKFKLSEGKIITYDYKETIVLEGKKIEFKPIYEWFLE